VSGYSVLLFVGSTTLVAAVVTLCAFQITAAKFERRMNSRSRTLEGPVPGRRSLSTIGLNTESARNAPRSSRPPSRQPTTSIGLATDTVQELAPSTLLATSMLSLNKEAELNSLQTIRARSASLHTDARPEQSAGPRPLTPAGIPPVQRLPKRPASDLDQEQGPATPHAKSRPQKAGVADSMSPSSAPAAETAEPTIAPKTTPSKRGKRANNTQGERTGTAHRVPDQASPDALPSLDMLDALQPSDIGGSLSPDDGLPDIFAGLNEAEAGIQGLSDDLSDIDGGGLPSTAQKTPQRSRR
jgi:hypothetical protein